MKLPAFLKIRVFSGLDILFSETCKKPMMPIFVTSDWLIFEASN